MAVLRSVGARPAHVFGLFMSEACVLALVSAALGLMLGYAGHFYLATRGIDIAAKADVYRRIRGLADEVLERADARLEPILGPTDYNHLSVRAAAAIR